jgi:hypothetical protein
MMIDPLFRFLMKSGSMTFFCNEPLCAEATDVMTERKKSRVKTSANQGLGTIMKTFLFSALLLGSF